MCSGTTIIFFCGHNETRFLVQCEDARSNTQSISHRVLGLTHRLSRRCHPCQHEQDRADTQADNERRRLEDRAVALKLYYDRGRTFPCLDDELAEYTEEAYRCGERLHPWITTEGNFEYRCRAVRYTRLVVRARTEDLATRELASRPIDMLHEMARRQAEIDLTRRPLTAQDRQFRLALIDIIADAVNCASLAAISQSMFP